METQDLIVLRHLKQHRHITSWEAITKYHITRLSAKIYNLRQLGYNITSQYERNDETGANYVRYFLIREKNWSEEDLLSMDKEKFTGVYDISDEEYEMAHKEFQEM